MIPLRLARELTYQLDEAGEHERLAKALASLPVFQVLFQSVEESELLSAWKRLADCDCAPRDYYEVSLAAIRATWPKYLPIILPGLGQLFHRRGEFEYSSNLYSELVDLGTRSLDHSLLMNGHRGLGVNYFQQGDYPNAMSHFEKALVAAQRMGSSIEIAHTMSKIGNVHWAQGNYDEALKTYQSWYGTCEANGDQRGMSRAIGNIGSVYARQGQFDLALEALQQQLAIAERVRDLHGEVTALGNIGSLYGIQGKFEQAMEVFKRDLTISEAVGDLLNVASVSGNIGSIHGQLGRYDRALEWIERQLTICTSLGDRSGILYATQNIAVAYLQLHRYPEAIEFFSKALAGQREIESRFGMATSLQGLAKAILDQYEGGRMSGDDDNPRAVVNEASDRARFDDLNLARQLAKECLEISRQISKPDTIFETQILLARIEWSVGNSPDAVSALGQLHSSTEDPEQKAETDYWLWRVTGAEPFRIRCLEGYSQLLEYHPKFAFRRTIAELRGEPQPT